MGGRTEPNAHPLDKLTHYSCALSVFLSTIVVVLISQNTILHSSAAAGPQQNKLNGVGEELMVNRVNPLDMTQMEQELCAFRLVCGHLWLPNELRSSEPQ